MRLNSGFIAYNPTTHAFRDVERNEDYFVSGQGRAMRVMLDTDTFFTLNPNTKLFTLTRYDESEGVRPATAKELHKLLRGNETWAEFGARAGKQVVLPAVTSVALGSAIQGVVHLAHPVTVTISPPLVQAVAALHRGHVRNLHLRPGDLRRPDPWVPPHDPGPGRFRQANNVGIEFAGGAVGAAVAVGLVAPPLAPVAGLIGGVIGALCGFGLHEIF